MYPHTSHLVIPGKLDPRPFSEFLNREMLLRSDRSFRGLYAGILFRRIERGVAYFPNYFSLEEAAYFPTLCFSFILREIITGRFFLFHERRKFYFLTLYSILEKKEFQSGFGKQLFESNYDFSVGNKI